MTLDNSRFSPRHIIPPTISWKLRQPQTVAFGKFDIVLYAINAVRRLVIQPRYFYVAEALLRQIFPWTAQLPYNEI